MENIRIASAQAIKKARELRAKEVGSVIHGSGAGGLSHPAASQAVIEGSLLGMYHFDQLKSKEETGPEINTLTLVESDPSKFAEVETSVTRSQKIIQGVFLTRDLVNLPPNMATPTYLAQCAQKIADEFGIYHRRQRLANNRMELSKCTRWRTAEICVMSATTAEKRNGCW
jgi:leucyl aminopeptidase